MPCDSHWGLPGLGSSGLLHPRPHPESRVLSPGFQSTTGSRAKFSRAQSSADADPRPDGNGDKVEPSVHWALLSAGCDLENVFVPTAPSWCRQWKRRVLARPGLRAENCLFGQLRTRLQLNHKIRRKPLAWVAGSWFPPMPVQARE